jgi:hypothetical protein
MMAPDHFELQMSVPRDPRFAATLRGLVVHAAHYAGCPDGRADAFGDRVEEVVRAYFADNTMSQDVPIVVRRAMAGPLEIQIAAHVVSLDL